jgi:hypothetical protein
MTSVSSSTDLRNTGKISEKSTRAPESEFEHEDGELVYKFAELCQMNMTTEFDRLITRCVRMLRLCDYPPEDVRCILAHASKYVAELSQFSSNPMAALEQANVACLYIYVAHTFVEDECCPLMTWHKHLFRRYCSPKTLHAAVSRLMQMRDWRFRLGTEELNERLMALGEL